jgi:hypothetical protein
MPTIDLKTQYLVLSGRLAVEIDPRLVHGPAQAVFAIRDLNGVNISGDRHELSHLFVGEHNDGHWHSPVSGVLLAILPLPMRVSYSAAA